MTKKLIAVDLFFPETVQFFGPMQEKHCSYPKRQKVRGKLRLVASRPTKLQSIEIKFKGHSHLTWRDPLKAHFIAQKMHAWKTLRKSKSILLQDATLPAGVTDLGFEVTIPGYLCPSFKSEFLEIQYLITAKILGCGKFAKETHIERPVQIHKTLLPKHVAQGQTLGYQVPKVIMHGERPANMKWEFKVPTWVCLENDAGIEFVGNLQSLADVPLEITRIEVDVIQEELYRYDISDDEFQGTKRHLIVCSNQPSIYLHPPLNTSIAFSFPLQTILDTTKYRLRRVKSVPLQPTIHDDHFYLMPDIKSTITRGRLTYSLESPFLQIRHYIRVLIYYDLDERTVIPPICIGLPFAVTRQITLLDNNADGLPSYHSVTRDGERLPHYTVDEAHETEQEDEEENEEGEGRGCAGQEPLDPTQPPPNRHPADPPPNSANGSTARRRKRAAQMVVQERTLDNFWILTSH
ncbi:uncharacterized protein BYT42DRAFT_577278 [Radiomyces spectabilis]|uniref:uncharacterized protein n=1 Tax=Radiomyces spectabilis TaxID=64574 RepID=UPI00222033CE|nr:uncharacterized protein BYT42DRAFT_577278 [Radiomyces spectabilis]KAI8374686.1 hypothetical protein BYT42DRAFT_577278 [Radiomyces spectabilis]